MVVAIATVFDDVFFKEDLGGAHSHEVGDGDAAGVEYGVGAMDGVTHDADGVVATGAEVDLWDVEAVNIGVELAVGDLWRALSVGGG